ncbi:hypothetical protein DFH08DRAFT_825590 [Mycena albidolilacea]|uniref:Uncharacterized protein n=1 Tax=Mycena albidolilacea TaxID=1033008 RepID=A0AAD6Z1R7_9AGAR|nr:hypothetical protein DFH08DRAFT_825590 [Mycena albidolilacea]
MSYGYDRDMRCAESSRADDLVLLHPAVIVRGVISGSCGGRRTSGGFGCRGRGGKGSGLANLESFERLSDGGANEVGLLALQGKRELPGLRVDPVWKEWMPRSLLFHFPHLRTYLTIDRSHDRLFVLELVTATVEPTARGRFFYRTFSGSFALSNYSSFPPIISFHIPGPSLAQYTPDVDAHDELSPCPYPSHFPHDNPSFRVGRAPRSSESDIPPPPFVPTPTSLVPPCPVSNDHIPAPRREFRSNSPHAVPPNELIAPASADDRVLVPPHKFNSSSPHAVPPIELIASAPEHVPLVPASFLGVLLACLLHGRFRAQLHTLLDILDDLDSEDHSTFRQRLHPVFSRIPHFTPVT